MSTEDFFQEQLEQSRVKTSIIVNYFAAWAKIIIRSLKRTGRGGKILYLDLFCGPGRYDSGEKSTPLLILDNALSDNEITQYLYAFFNDKEIKCSQQLKKEIANISGINKLKYYPKVTFGEINEETASEFQQMHLIPTLLFADPCGYKGLTKSLITSIVKDWGCDCIFFFNYARINMALSKINISENVSKLFGSQICTELQEKIKDKNPREREKIILDGLNKSYFNLAGKFLLTFTFKRGKQTSHHLIFLSKNVAGYNAMKGIMARVSYKINDIPTYTFNSEEDYSIPLFDIDNPIPFSQLKDDLILRFKGKRITMKQIFQKHNVGTPFISSNYKKALTDLELEGRITATPTHTKRQKRQGKPTFADSVIVRFPDL